MVELIIAIVVVFIALGLSLIVLIFNNKSKKYTEEALKEIYEKTLTFYDQVELINKHYFPYFKEHAYQIMPKISSKGEIDPLTKFEIKKHYVYIKDPLLYIFDNKIRNEFEVLTIEDKEVFDISKIRKLEILVTFAEKLHFLVEYKIIRIGKEEYRLELINIKEDFENEEN